MSEKQWEAIEDMAKRARSMARTKDSLVHLYGSDLSDVRISVCHDCTTGNAETALANVLHRDLPAAIETAIGELISNIKTIESEIQKVLAGKLPQ